MSRTLRRAAALAALLLGSAALAQQPQPSLPQPRVNTAFPCGAQAGTTVEVTVTGTDLDEPVTLTFSHPKIKAEEIATPEPKADPKKGQPGKGRRKGPPAASVKFKVTVPADVPVGQYDVRAVNKWGVSNPRAFVVGDRPEVLELEPNNDVHDVRLERSASGLVGGPMVVPVKESRAQRVELGTVVHGVISAPTDVDYVVFTGKAGQRVLINCQAASIDSKARPLVEVYAPDGRRIGQNRNYKDTDALADVTLPADGDYFVRVSEFAYQQGGPDYFYRLTVGTGPWVDAVFPPAVNPGKPAQVTLYGRNLPGGKPVSDVQVDGRPVESLTVTVNPPTDPAARTRLGFRGRVAPPMGLQDGFEYRLTGPTGASNAVPIFLTDARVVTEKEGNDTPETAQPLTLPCEVAGRIDKRHDRDYYSFTAKKGDVLFIEATAEQVGSLSDLYLRVRDEKNKDLSPELDDDPDVLHPIAFYTRNGDPPAYKFTAPADGKYLVLVGSIDANVSFGPRCYYRLRVGPAAPDFRAVVMADAKETPTAVVARAEGETAYEVYVHRSGGYAGPVTATAENLPPGVTAKPALIGTGMKWGTLVLSAAAGAKEFVGPIAVKCTATIDGKQVAREARPATITWAVPPQQNIPTVTRLDQELVFAVRPDRAPFRLTADLAGAKLATKDKDGKAKEEKVAGGPIFVKPGDKLTIPVKVAWHEKDARAQPVNVRMEATQPNMQQAPLVVNNNQPVALAPKKDDGPVAVDVRPNAAPGTYSVVLRGEVQLPFVRDPEQKDKKANVTASAYTQPIEVTVLPTSLAKLTIQPPPNNTLKLGTTAELTVKVDRQHDYAGPFTVTVTLPKDAKGVTVKEATIPAGKDEVKVPLVVAKDAKPGGLSNVVVQAVATVHGKFPVVHETKLNLNVAK